CVQYFGVSHTHDFDVTQFTHGPRGIVIDRTLWIAGRPILIIEQRVGDPAVRLIHPDDVSAGWKGAVFSLWLLRIARWWIAVARAGGSCGGFLLDGHGEWRGRATDLNGLRLQRAQQLRLIAGTQIVAGQNISGRPFVLWLQD